MYKITVFPGDGIGPEVTAQAMRVLSKVAKLRKLNFQIEEALAGGVSSTTCSSVLVRGSTKAICS